MKTQNAKGLREGAMVVALTAVLMLLTRYMPLFSIFGTFVCAIPLAILAARNELKVVIPALVASFAVAVLINGNLLSAASLVLMSCLPGMIAGYMMGKKFPFFAVIISTSLAVCIGWIFELVILEMFMDRGLDEIFTQTMREMETMISGLVNSMGDTLETEGGVSPEQLLESLISTTESLIRLYFPTFIVVSSMFTAYIIIRLSGFIINRTKLANVEVTPFSRLKAPHSMSIASILFYMVYIFMNPKAGLYPVFANIVFILYMILGICGLSFVDFKFKLKVKSAAVRFLIYIIVFLFGGVFSGIISSVLIFIGILDAGRDFRQIENCGPGGGVV